MYHILYKTTNKITGKIYIGAHSTNNLQDGYVGSGKQLKDAVKKYGIENFTFEVLETFETREEAFQKEFEIVTEKFVGDAMTYNMCVGGLGSSIKTKEWKDRVSNKLKGRKFTDEHRRKKSLAQTGEKNHRFGKHNPNTPKLYGEQNGMYGKTHTEESKKIMSENRKKAVINYTPELIESLSKACKGKLWYNNGKISKRFYEGTEDPGFERGRLSKTKIEQEVFDDATHAISATKIRKEMGLK